MLALLKLIPIKDWLYTGIIAALLIGFWYYTVHERELGAAREMAALQASSAKLQVAAQKQVAETAANYATTLNTIQEKQSDEIKMAAAQHDADARSLLYYDTYRRLHPALGSPASGPGTAGAGSSVAPTDDGRFSSLEQVALGLAGAARSDAGSLTACMADRDALTGR